MSDPKITPGMHIMPSPQSFAVGDADLGDGTKVVAVRIESVVGSFTFLLPAESARALAANIIHQAEAISSGLTIPKIVPPANIFNGGPKRR